MSTPPITAWVPKVSAEPTPAEIHRLFTLAFQKLGNHATAFGLQQAKIDAIKGGTSTTIVEGGGGGGSIVPPPPPGGIPVNNQSGVTSYTTASTDDGALIVLSDASAIAVSLTSQSPPWSCFITNQSALGTGAATLTPASGTISYAGNPGAASMPLLGGSSVIVAFDGTNWWAWTEPTVPIATSSTFGIVKPDNTTITIAGGVISSVGGGSGPTITTNANGTAADFGGLWVHQFGTVGAVATGVARTTIAVTFPVAFAGTPKVICEPNNDPDSYGTAVFDCYPTLITSTGFLANLTCGVTIGGGGPANITNSVFVNWMADYA